MAAESLIFDRSLYLVEAVQAAADAYSGHARIELTNEPQQTMVSIAVENAAYKEIIIDAFCNHVLFETVVRSRETLGGVPI